jgi:DNA-binding SARP family transcriptional activator
MLEQPRWFRLRTLGTLDLVGPDGRELRAVLAQPKRTALLVYLALASPRGFHRRDTLAGLLWPELDAPRARAALSTAVYNLRRALGADVLLGRGVEELGLEFGRVWCDAAAFDEAVRAGDLEAALDLYGGGLLPGLHLDGAPEWERWLERERGRLRERARAAAWTLAERAEQADDLPQAAAWWRRALLLAAGDERTHRHLIALLDRSGDRAGALREYDALVRWLRTEFEAEPSAETRALIRAVRARSPGAAPEAASTERASTGAASTGAVGPERTGLAQAPPTAARDAPRDASVPADPPVLPAAPSPPEPVSPALLPTPAPAAGAPAGRTPPRAPRRWRRAVVPGSPCSWSWRSA